MASSVLAAEETSAEIQPSSLSGNQTRVPLLYMFSAMDVGGPAAGAVVVGLGQVGGVLGHLTVLGVSGATV